MLFNEPKLLKFFVQIRDLCALVSFSALQRAEIAEISSSPPDASNVTSFSALQRAEIAEMLSACARPASRQSRFSALQRAEIAEIW